MDNYIIVNDVNLTTTYIFEKYKSKFDKNIMYLPRFDRRFIISKEEMIAFDIAYKLEHGVTLKQKIEFICNLKDPFTHERMDKNSIIENGYMQVFNMIYSYLFFKPKVLIIDKIEMNLHPFLAKILVNFILKACKEYDTTCIITTDNDSNVNEQMSKQLDINELEKIMMEVVNNEF